MKYQKKIKPLLILFLSTVFIFSLSHIGAKAYQSITTSKDRFSEGTMIGSLSVAGLTTNEAMQLIDEQLTKWLDETVYVIKFKEMKEPFSLNYFTFDVEQSVSQAKDGKENLIVVTLEPFEDYLTELIPSLNLSNLQKEELESKLLKSASILTIGTYEVHLEEYLTIDVNEYETLAETTIHLENVEPFLDQSIEIQPYSQFSFLNYLEENTHFPKISLSKLSSAIYEVILSTNFIILERHISNELPENIHLGFEAKVDVERKLDFVFYNPNDSSYFIEFSEKNNQLLVSLKGTSFATTFNVLKEGEQTFEPKIIRQFHPQLAPTEIKVKREGKSGHLIQVYREHRDAKGQVLKKEWISEDYYPPIHQIEIQGLIPNESESDIDEVIVDDEMHDVHSGEDAQSSNDSNETNKLPEHPLDSIYGQENEIPKI